MAQISQLHAAANTRVGTLKGALTAMAASQSEMQRAQTAMASSCATMAGGLEAVRKDLVVRGSHQAPAVVEGVPAEKKSKA